MTEELKDNFTHMLKTYGKDETLKKTGLTHSELYVRIKEEESAVDIEAEDQGLTQDQLIELLKAVIEEKTLALEAFDLSHVIKSGSRIRDTYAEEGLEHFFDFMASRFFREEELQVIGLSTPHAMRRYHKALYDRLYAAYEKEVKNA